MISSPRIYLDQFLASPYTKAGLLIPLAIILTYLLARALIILSVSLTIGVIVREALPVFLALGLFLLIWASDLGSLAHSLTFRGFGLVHLGVLLAVAALTAFLVANYASLYNPTFSLISGLVLAGFLVSIFLALTSDGPEAVMPFLLAYPFLAYLEADWNFRDVLVNFLTLGPFSFTPTLIFICLLFLAIVFRKVATRQALTGTRLDLFVLGWLFLLFLSSLNSRLPEESLQEFLLDGIPVLLFFIVVNRVRTARDMIVLGASVLIASLLRLAVLYYFYRVLLRTEVDIGIVSSILKFGVHMGVLGWITHVTLPLSIAFFVILRDPRLRFALAGAAAFSVFVLLAIQLRSTVIAALAPALFLALYLRTRFMWLVGGAMGVVVGALIVSAIVPTWLEKFSSWSSPGAIIAEQTQRRDLWQAAIHITQDHPVLGVGLRMFQDFLPQYAENSGWLFTTEVQASGLHPHEVFLQYAVAGGVGALAALIGLHVVAFWTAWTTFKRLTDRRLQTLALALFWAFASMAASGTIGGTNFATASWQGTPAGPADVGMWFWLVVGLIFASSKLQRAQPGPTHIE